MPVIGDHVGGLVGLGLLAFGAVGRITHGVTSTGAFRHFALEKKRQPGNGWSMPHRVYVRELDLMLNPDEAGVLLDGASRARSLFGCRNRHCCPRGVQDMIENPARHFLYRRVEDVAELGQTPGSLRAQTFLDRHLRPTTDHALAAANINWSDKTMADKTRNQRKRLGCFKGGVQSPVGGGSTPIVGLGAAAASGPGRARLSPLAGCKKQKERGETMSNAVARKLKSHPHQGRDEEHRRCQRAWHAHIKGFALEPRQSLSAAGGREGPCLSWNTSSTNCPTSMTHMRQGFGCFHGKNF